MGAKIIKDIDLINDVKKYDLVLVGTSILNKLGNGFQYKVGLNFPEVFEASKVMSKYGDLNKLGKVDFVDTEPNFALCYITKGRFSPKIKPDALEYEALRRCLKQVKKHYSGASIASTIMGASIYEGGGDRDRIISIFNEVLGDEDVTLYDYVQKNVTEEKKLLWKNVTDKLGTPEYEEIKKKYFWETNFGIYTPMPEDKSPKEIKEIIEEAKNMKKNFASFK